MVEGKLTRKMTANIWKESCQSEESSFFSHEHNMEDIYLDGLGIGVNFVDARKYNFDDA